MNTQPPLEERTSVENRWTRLGNKVLNEAKHLIYEVPTAAVGFFVGSETGYYISEHVFRATPSVLYYNLGWQDTQNTLSYYGGGLIGVAVGVAAVRYIANRIRNRN